MSKHSAILTFLFLALAAVSSHADNEPVGNSLEIVQTVIAPVTDRGLVSPGDDVVLTFHANNAGDASRSGVTVEYLWPPGLAFIDAKTVPAAAVQFREDGSMLEWYVGDLAPAGAAAQSALLQVIARVEPSAVGSNIDHTVDVAADAGASVTVAPAIRVAGMATSDIAVTNSGSFSRSGNAYIVTYEVTVTNNGPDAAPTNGVFLNLEIDPVTEDNIEDGTLTGPANTACDVDLLSCVIFDLAVGESVTFTATARVLTANAPINIPVDFVITSNDVDSDLTNNRSFGNVGLPAPPDSGGGGGGGGVASWMLLLLLLTAFARLGVLMNPERSRHASTMEWRRDCQQR